MAPDLDKILQVAKDAALQAGAKIRDVVSSQRDGGDARGLAMKSSSTDLVTETDRQCEDIVTRHIRASFPDHKIIGEEASGSDRYELTDECTWTIDPIGKSIITSFTSYWSEDQMNLCIGQLN